MTGDIGGLSMELLFRREQTAGKLARVNFKLWGKVELDEEEQALVTRYRFDDAMLIEVLQPNLIRQALFIGIGAFIAAATVLSPLAGVSTAVMLGLLAGGGAAYWWINEKRETIFVRDLLHGRNFKCDSVIELAKKEAFLTTTVSFLRQVMESAKHWDGTQRYTIEPLPKDEARQVILRGV
jgi:hypothetical protein